MIRNIWGVPARTPEVLVRRLLATPLRVLLTGETGTGKNHLAYLFRSDAVARGMPFVEINAANLPDDLFEGELFGARRGAYTGAMHDRPGVLARADGGVLFLNEVGELTPAGQSKLLTVLDTGLYRRLGEPTDRRFTGRVIAATNRHLPEAVQQGQFRADLHYRLAQVTIVVPPLRQRPHDIGRLALEFLAVESAARVLPLAFEPAAMAALVHHAWPGNVRQLRSVVEILAWLAPPNGGITLSAVREHLWEDEVSESSVDASSSIVAGVTVPPLRTLVDDLERREIVRALVTTGGNKMRAARRLGLSVVGLRLKLRRLGLPE